MGHCLSYIFERPLLGTPRVAVTVLAGCESGALCGSIAVGLYLQNNCIPCFGFLGVGRPVVVDIPTWREEPYPVFLRS